MIRKEPNWYDKAYLKYRERVAKEKTITRLAKNLIFLSWAVGEICLLVLRPCPILTHRADFLFIVMAVSGWLLYCLKYPEIARGLLKRIAEMFIVIRFR